ncbi:MAG: SURF1 family protein [Ilumatobacteraceae bacterium]
MERRELAMLTRPRWIAFHLLVVIGIVGMVNLGLWQLRRLDQRQDFNDTVTARLVADPVPLDDVLPADATIADPIGVDEIEWRTASISGRYLPDAAIRIVNRSQNGRAGDNIVVPLDLGDGRTLLVNRGFVPLGVDDPPLPATDVTVTGVLHPSQQRTGIAARDPDRGALTEAQRVDLERLADQMPGRLLPVYLDLTVSDPPETGGLPEPVISPDLSEGNHLSYAIQWFIFSIAVAAGWVLAVRVSLRRTQQQATDPPSSPTAEPLEASG